MWTSIVGRLKHFSIFRFHEILTISISCMLWETKIRLCEWILSFCMHDLLIFTDHKADLHSFLPNSVYFSEFFTLSPFSMFIFSFHSSSQIATGAALFPFPCHLCTLFTSFAISFLCWFSLYALFSSFLFKFYVLSFSPFSIILILSYFIFPPFFFSFNSLYSFFAFSIPLRASFIFSMSHFSPYRSLFSPSPFPFPCAKLHHLVAWTASLTTRLSARKLLKMLFSFPFQFPKRVIHPTNFEIFTDFTNFHNIMRNICAFIMKNKWILPGQFY